jgi:hypothetical protein
MGHEYDVLKGDDLRRYRPSVILVETTKPCFTSLVDDFQAISDYICTSGHQQIYFDGKNTWWLAQEEFQQRIHTFKYPVGVF